jgi:hypothetical protein
MSAFEEPPRSSSRNTESNFFQTLASHGRDFAMFTLEIFDDVKVGVSDTVESVIGSISESRGKNMLNEIIDDIMQSYANIFESWSDPMALNPDELFLGLVNR